MIPSSIHRDLSLIIHLPPSSFVALNGVMLSAGASFRGPGYDSGSEENNERCSSIPGPACPRDDPDVPINSADGNGESFVHVHRGVFGLADLTQSVYDWRNLMLAVSVGEPYYAEH